MTIELPFTFEPPTEARLKEAHDLIRYESSISFHSDRAKESMKILLSEAVAARKLREGKTETEDTAVLHVGRSYSRCGNCGKDTLPRAIRHIDVSGYQPEEGGGCGALFVALRSEGCSREELQRVRPDLPVDESPELQRDTLGEWLQWRFGPRKEWAKLPDEEKDYWEHQAQAVRRAVDRGGFKNPNPSL